jgi:hypothetical protein
MAGTLAPILAGKASLVEGKIRIEEIPANVGLTTEERAKLTATPIITVSATEPTNPVEGQIWIDIS